ncbi:universal stress protein [Streptomyces sp. NPDC050549]|uniref:universal stress protein n=1 Tax=Streptomyces sp. NPDC050549 TaxID=3155406 RepID=UPI00341DD94D
MSGSSGGRVIVGVDDSTAGLLALRAAVAQARGLDRELIAIRAYPAPAGGGTAWQSPSDGRLPRLPQPPTSGTWHRLRAACEERELGAVERIFEQALGGVPQDVRVHQVASVGPPGRVLVAAAHRDDDLLVVGGLTARRLRRVRPWRWFRCSTCRYCTAHATCPVLTIPVSGPARWSTGSLRHRDSPEKALDVMRQPLHPRETIRDTDTEAAGTHGWPTRACCCSAPPQVKVLMPFRNGRPVDLYLCGHHYRASIDTLVLADATTVFRDRPSAVSLSGHG